MNFKILQESRFLLAMFIVGLIGIVLLGSTLLCNYADSYMDGAMGNTCTTVLDITYYYVFPAHLIGELVESPYVSGTIFLLVLTIFWTIITVIIYLIFRQKFTRKKLGKSKYWWILCIILCVVAFTTIWNTQISQKEYFEQKIMNDSQYCTGRTDTPNCICQPSYYKVMQRDWTKFRYNCIPYSCKSITGQSFDGHSYIENIDMCEWAARNVVHRPCYSIKYLGGRDTCILTYVSVSHDKNACTNISSNYMRHECNE